MGVVALGLLFVFAAKTASMGPIGRELKQGTLVNLAAVRGTAELERLLEPILPSEPERRFVAQKIFDHLPGPGERRLDDVDAMPTIRLPADDVAGRADLASLGERARAVVAAARDGSAPATRVRGPAASSPQMFLLTTAQFRDLRESLVVRTQGAFRPALFLHAL